MLSDAASQLEFKLVQEWVGRAAPNPDAVDVFRIPPARRRRKVHEVDGRIADRLNHQDNPLVVPVRVIWTGDAADVRRGPSLREFLTLRDPRDPDVITQHVIARRAPNLIRLALGQPAGSGELRTMWESSVEATSFDDFVGRRAWLALERAERQLRGTRYKIPKFVREEILSRDEFRRGLTALVPAVGRPPQQMERKARRYLKEIAASHSPFVIDLVASAIRLLYRQGYGYINYDASQFQDLYTLGTQYPLVFLPSHKSNLDHLVLQYLLWENNLPPNHTAGGINMNFFPVGPLIRRTGVFFIRRTFKDNETYKYVLRSYIEYLIEKRFPLEWYIEGGRSRSGKLMAPRYGMLAYVADALASDKSDDVYLIPTSIAYDHIQEIRTYSAEQRGEAKEKESAAWLLKAVRSLRKRYGNIHLRFGEPLSLQKELDTSLTGDARHLALQKVAFEVSVRINRATPITPTSLATVALLAHPDRAQTARELCASIGTLIDEITERRLPTTAPLVMLQHPEGIREAMEGLAEHGIVDITEGPETVYRITDQGVLGAAFYRNTIIHFFVNEAIAELALAMAQTAHRGHVESFWAHVANLRDLLKFEFFFPERDEFREEIHQSLSRTATDWESQVASGPDGVERILRSARSIHAPWVLRSFLEAYDIAGRTLDEDTIDGEFNEKRFLAAALARGQQYAAQKSIKAPDAVSQSLFKTALQLAANRDLIDEQHPAISERRADFRAELESVLDGLDRLSEIVSDRSGS